LDRLRDICEESMDATIPGLHHITAIAGDPQRNLDFYTGVLGLRLVKLTVNFDDPFSYHLYYGDHSATPGSILTFFAWPTADRGRQGTGQVGVMALAIAPSSLAHWVGRLIRRGIKYDGPTRRFDEQVIAFRDPDGLLLELVAHPRAADRPAADENAIRGIHSVTLWTDGSENTAQFLTGTLGFRPTTTDEQRQRFEIGNGGSGAIVDLHNIAGFWEGAEGIGTVHHIAWRAANDAAQGAWRERLRGSTNVTPVRDRKYFHSIYFHEPGGVLFEIATDAPGFAIDEPVDQLGSALQLPPWLAAQHDAIERSLPPLRLPNAIQRWSWEDEEEVDE
jgi:glyoxalase family protein